LHVAQLMPLPLAVSCFSKIQIGFTFLVPAHPGSPGKRAVKQVCVCACVRVCVRVCVCVCVRACVRARAVHSVQKMSPIVTHVVWSVCVSVCHKREMCKNG